MAKEHSFDGIYPSWDGSIEEYLRIFHSSSASPLFRGVESFYELRNKGLLLPRWSMIRLMWGLDREDEHFDVTEEYRLEGIQAPAHSGREGIFAPETLLTKRVKWEAQRLLRLKSD